jgi:hypothetical protein
MDTNTTLSKTYASEMLNGYINIVENVNDIIDMTGYKGKYIAKKMGIPATTFYQKRRRKSFTTNEIKLLIDLMDDDDDAIEDAFFMKISKERENDDCVSLDVLDNYLKTRMGK